MNTRDLRIDDFVYYADMKYKIIEISGGQAVVCIERKYRYGLADISNIQPIPITDELLEKIGFKNKSRGNHSLGYRLVSDTGYALIWHAHETGKYIISALDNKSLVISGGKRISYLHELQHELYDAGIDIKIELE